MKRKKTGLTMIELLIVLAIIALLVGLLVPSLSAVKQIAKETKQKAQLSAIEMALAAFKNDEGDYPSSDGWLYNQATGSSGPLDYCGAQKLTEALVGWDLLGFHPQSSWDSVGTAYADPDLSKRKGPYLELASTNVFRLGNSTEGVGLFNDTRSDVGLAPHPFVICDVFGVKKITFVRGIDTVIQNAGTPILYYKANTSSQSLQETSNLRGDGIYDYRDNRLLVGLRSLADYDKSLQLRQQHRIEDIAFFYERIRDPKITARPWPYRPDSYILISAGADGIYGTDDDITNFGN